MDISEQIIRKIAEFESKTGEKPKQVYLGLFDKMDLYEFMRRRFGLKKFKTKHAEEFYGIEIYLVDVDRHINVC